MDTFIFLLRFIELFIMFSIIESNKFFKIEEKRSEKLIEISSYRFFFIDVNYYRNIFNYSQVYLQPLFIYTLIE